MAEGGGPDISDNLCPPELIPGAEGLLTAFWELSTDRQIGMAAGPLPAASIDRWLQAVGCDDPDDAGEAIACFRAMDAVYLGQEAPPESEKPKGRLLTMELFDALWD